MLKWLRERESTANPSPAGIPCFFSLDKGRCLLHAYVPLAELFGYTSELRNFTSGTASFTMEPSHYASVKEELADIRQAS